MKANYTVQTMTSDLCKLILVSNYPAQNIVDHLGISATPLSDLKNRYTVGAWKIKQLKQK